MLIIDLGIVAKTNNEWNDMEPDGTKSPGFLRSDDPARELVDYYRAWIKAGNDGAKWSTLKAPEGWRSEVRYQHAW